MVVLAVKAGEHEEKQAYLRNNLEVELTEWSMYEGWRRKNSKRWLRLWLNNWMGVSVTYGSIKVGWYRQGFLCVCGGGRGNGSSAFGILGMKYLRQSNRHAKYSSIAGGCIHKSSIQGRILGLSINVWARHIMNIKTHGIKCTNLEKEYSRRKENDLRLSCM